MQAESDEHEKARCAERCRLEWLASLSSGLACNEAHCVGCSTESHVFEASASTNFVRSVSCRKRSCPKDRSPKPTLYVRLPRP